MRNCGIPQSENAEGAEKRQPLLGKPVEVAKLLAVVRTVESFCLLFVAVPPVLPLGETVGAGLESGGRRGQSAG